MSAKLKWRVSVVDNLSKRTMFESEFHDNNYQTAKNKAMYRIKKSPFADKFKGLRRQWQLLNSKTLVRKHRLSYLAIHLECIDGDFVFDPFITQAEQNASGNV